jgi:hypothetical protein
VLPQALHAAHVAPPLRALILRMLSMNPEQRGTAAQLAKELERAADSLSVSSTPVNVSNPRTPMRSWRPWLAAGAMGLALVMWTRWMTPGESVESASVAQEVRAEADEADAGPVGLGDAVASASTEDSAEAHGPKVMAEDTLPEPQPGQARPDAKGRCPRKRQVSLNGGCWGKLSLDQEGCTDLNGRMYKGSCYLPIIPPGRSPTSSPADQR